MHNFLTASIMMKLRLGFHCLTTIRYTLSVTLQARDDSSLFPVEDRTI
jgi:hypothetical protein